MKAISLLALVWFISVFVISGLSINFCQVVIRPLLWVAPDFYRCINAKLLYLLFHQLTFLGEWWGVIDITVYGKQEELEKMGSESIILMANHYSDVDFLVGWIMAGRYDCLAGIKTFAKHSSKYIPIIGWCWYFSDFGFVKRNWEEDKSSVFSTLEPLKKYPVTFWMCIFPEGTRRTPQKICSSNKYAVEHGIEPLKHHLLPRPKGLAVAVKQLGSSLPAVYEMELGLDDPEAATITTLINRGTVKAHVNFRRIPMESIPKDSLEDTSQWCKDIFRRKDAEQEYFARNGKFEAPVAKLRPRKFKNLITFGILNLLTGIFVSNLFCRGVATFGLWPVVTCVVLLMIGGLLFLQRLIRATDTKQGSSYGLHSANERLKVPTCGKQD